MAAFHRQCWMRTIGLEAEVARMAGKADAEVHINQNWRARTDQFVIAASPLTKSAKTKTPRGIRLNKNEAVIKQSRVYLRVFDLDITLGIMNISSWLRREHSFPQWMSPPQWLRKTARLLWAFLSCAFGIGAAMVAIPSPFGGLLLVLAGGIALASKSRKVWLDLFVLEGRGAQFFAGCWLIVGLILCIKHYF